MNPSPLIKKTLPLPTRKHSDESFTFDKEDAPKGEGFIRVFPGRQRERLLYQR